MSSGVLAYAAALLWQHARLSASALVVLGLLAGTTAPLTVWAMSGLIDTLSATTGLPADPWPSVRPWLGALLAAFVFRSLQTGGARYLTMINREQLRQVMYRQVFALAVALPLDRFEQPDYFRRLDHSRRALEGGGLANVIEILMGLVSALIGAAGLVFLFAQAHWLLAVLLTAATIVRSVVAGRESRRFWGVVYDHSASRQELRYWSDLLASHLAAAELRLFGLGDWLLARWRQIFHRYAINLSRVRWQMALHSLASGILQEAVGWLTLLALLLLARQGTVSLGTLIALLYGLNRFRQLTDDIAGGVIPFTHDISRLADLRAFLALAPEAASRSSIVKPPRPLRQGVRCHQLSFTYPGADRPALSDIDLTLGPQERVALVGENGAGKTTLGRLLLNLYRPDAGRITVDGQDLADLDPREWRRQATAIFQDYMRYPTSVAENIGYADVRVLAAPPAALRAHPRLVAAAEQSGAAAFIAELPAGYATLLGKEFAGAVELSAGQWQRLALARAYLRDAQIVVLDEPTAALDPRAEVAVYRQFRAAAAGRCAVFISHRLGSARLADRIVVLRAGRIVEEGTHETLLTQEGEYARMFRLQAGWYGTGSPLEPVA